VRENQARLRTEWQAQLHPSAALLMICLASIDLQSNNALLALPLAHASAGISIRQPDLAENGVLKQQ
jgi:hypothetical protein